MVTGSEPEIDIAYKHQWWLVEYLTSSLEMAATFKLRYFSAERRFLETEKCQLAHY